MGRLASLAAIVSLAACEQALGMDGFIDAGGAGGAAVATGSGGHGAGGASSAGGGGSGGGGCAVACGPGTACVGTSCIAARFGYVANIADGTVSIFTVEGATGQLRARGYALSHPGLGSPQPIATAVDAAGKFI